MKPTRTSILARLTLALATTAALAAPPAATDASAQLVISQESRCLADLAIGARHYIESILRARTRCVNRIIIGELPATTDCVNGQGDPKLSKRLARAQDRLSNVGAQCGGVSLTLLGMPGNCPDPNGAPFDTLDFQNCVVDRTNDIVPTMLDYYYPPIDGFVRGSAAKCMKGAPQDGSASFRRTLRVRTQCLLDQDVGLVAADVDCRNEIQPYGPGTGDADVDRNVSRAYVRLLGAVPASCVDVQIDDLDYQSSCFDPTGGLFTIFDLKNCFFDVNQIEILDSLDITFPTAPVCGDGRKNGTEECDNGTQNSDTKKDACRTNCKLPYCGDKVADTGEQCDDGNTDNSDGCTTTCTTAVVPGCGNGVKETDRGEECDDGNTDDNDGCSAACLDEYCGDDVTQPPREQCDNGVDNSDTTPNACRTNCKNPFCGDGVVDTGEQCDDGNTVNDAGCLADCTNPPVCGDGIKGPGETCDTNGNIGCSSGQVCQSCTSPCVTPPPACPGVGELVLYAGVGRECDTNADCPVGACDGGRCHTATRLDSGWNGNAHDADINDGIRTRGFLDCPGSGPVCGECNVIGIDPSTRACRCANNTRVVCDEPFASGVSECPACANAATRTGGYCSSNTDCLDAQKCSLNVKVCSNDNTAICAANVDCTSGGTCTVAKTACNGTKSKLCTSNADCSFQGTCTSQSACYCYFGAPFPLSSGGTPACVLNRFAENISGTANVDLGAGEITAKLRTVVYLGESTTNPCPTCGGKCSNDSSKLCNNNADCSGGSCNLDPVLDDGVRGGFCTAGDFQGQSCDATALNTSFPTYPGGPNGGYYSLDCAPLNGKNVSGSGLIINLTQSTGTSSLTSQVNCDPNNPGALCPCMQCSGDSEAQQVSCNSNADCASQPGLCSLAPLVRCTQNADCTSTDVGPCVTISNTRKCNAKKSVTCSTNSDCLAQPAGDCIGSTCTSIGTGDQPSPNQCSDGVCDDQGGIGECATGPDGHFCDAVVKANGGGILSCNTNDDCLPSAVGIDAGNCTVTERRSCFPDPISATGDADPSKPLGAAVFCVPPTGNQGINAAAGLPGAGRILNQATSRTFCGTSDKQYIPGVGGCLD